MLILGIEGSANKLGIAILENENVLFNERKTFFNQPGEGFRPVELVEHHTKNILSLIKQSLIKTNKKLNEIELVAYTRGPGIAGALNVCAVVARIIAIELNIKIIGVNHCIAHIEMGKFVTGLKNPVVLYASGANTQIICYNKESNDTNKNIGRYYVLGEALDIAVGNCIDRIGRLLKISNDPSPGYNIEQKAKMGKQFYKIPIPIKGMDISCSGVVAYLEQFLKGKELTDELINDICYSLQENLFAALTEVTERAMSLYKSNEILIVGGVGCNERLQGMIKIMAEERGAVVGKMDDRFCVDNGAMIAYTGFLMFNGLGDKVEECDVTQRFRTETVKVYWNK